MIELYTLLFSLPLTGVGKNSVRGGADEKNIFCLDLLWPYLNFSSLVNLDIFIYFYILTTPPLLE